MKERPGISVHAPLLGFWPGHFIYIGTGVDTVVHDHHAIQIAISFGDPIELILPGSSAKIQAAIIDSDQPHECRTRGNTFLLLNVEPESKIGAGLKKACLAGQKMTALDGLVIDEFKEEIRLLMAGAKALDSLHQLALRFLRLLAQTPEAVVLDDRIVKLLAILHRPGDTPVKIRDLAEQVHVSPSRLIHLFTDQVGIPIRKYILWSRLVMALQELSRTQHMTRAALHGGFSDAPHFNRTFKRMFGLNPSLLLKNSQIIQAYY